MARILKKNEQLSERKIVNEETYYYYYYYFVETVVGRINFAIQFGSKFLRANSSACFNDFFSSFYLSGCGIDNPRVLVVVENRRIAGVPVVPHPPPLQASQLADHAISGFLSPKFPRVPFVPPRRKFQLLLPQP